MNGRARYRRLVVRFVGGLIAILLFSGCVGQYKSDFSVTVVNQAGNAIQVLVNDREIGQVDPGATRRFSLNLAETTPNTFVNGVAATPQADVTVAARDLKTGVLSSPRNLTLLQNAPAAVTFTAADFSGVEVIARFTFTPAAPGINEEVTFNAVSSTSGGGSFAWDFGDGSAGAGSIVAHQYSRSGTFPVTLTIAGDAGRSTASRSVIVSTSSPRVVSSFTYSPVTPETDQEVFFNAWSSVPTSGTLVWQFGDGARGAGLTPTHRYARAGTYTVSLTVTSEAGQSATSSRAIYVTAPGPPLDAIEQCGQMPDRLALVACIHALVNPPRTVAGAFEVAKRVAWVLRGEGAGLLIKNGGDNIVSWRGYSFSASRICFPDGHIYKVLADVPATNAPSWQDDDFVAPSLYVPAIDPRLP